MCPSFMNIVFFMGVTLFRTPWFQCCSFGTSLLIIIPNNTITLYGRELSLNIMRMTVIGTYRYSSKLYILHFGVAWTIAAQSINIASIRWDDHMHHHPNWQPRWISAHRSSKGFYVFSYLKSLLAVLSWTWQTLYILNSSYNSLGHWLAGNLYHAFWVLWCNVVYFVCRALAQST